MLAIYFCIFFQNGLSPNTADWGYFGSYLASITGILAFIGVLWSLTKSQEHYSKSEQREIENINRSYVFQLIDLYTKNFNSIIFLKNDTQTQGAEAFKDYTEEANKYYFSYIISFHFMKKWEEFKDFDAIKNYLYNDLKDTEYTYISLLKDAMLKPLGLADSAFFSDEEVFSSIRKCLIEQKTIPILDISKYRYDNLAKKLINNDEITKEDIIKGVSLVANHIYRDYGHILGHYFRNMYYNMRNIKSVDNTQNEYYKLFRAQISRYEIALGLFNSVSNKSSKEMINLLIYFGIFDELYFDDLVFFKEKNTEYNKDLLRAILNSFSR